MKLFSTFRKHPLKWSFLGLLLLFWLFSLPSPLFEDPYSLVLEDAEGKLLSAKIAEDGQWRFPAPKSIPTKFEKAILTFEDKRFRYHPGVDPISFGRAIIQNLKAGKVVSGGSTLTMQVIRLSRKGKSRTIWEKIIEVWLATRLELAHSKDEILNLYAAHAPFGGNVVGLDAASWRYFGKDTKLLSWSEAATLAVLPNSPALIHPGRNRQLLLNKRNRLLGQMLEETILDSLSYELALEEPIPNEPYALPRYAPHLLDRLALSSKDKKGKAARFRSTLNLDLQKQVNAIVGRHYEHLKTNEIHNLAAVVMDVETGKVLSYVGNVTDLGGGHGQAVDIIRAARSSGSILKPLLYAFMLQEGKILPGSIIPDVPINYSGYTPENFSETYDGMVPANFAISRSLNVPLVRMLEDYGLEKFHYDLTKRLDFPSINQSATYYGLPLILGGAEITLEDITNTYACMARSVNHFSPNSSRYSISDFRPWQLILKDSFFDKKQLVKEAPVLSAGASWVAFQAMRNLERPGTEGNWEVFNSGRPIAWKTGTSFGFKDAWSVGVTSRYAVGVWVGNADGEGRPGLIGAEAAAPVMFDIFEQLPNADWFEQPFDDMVEMEVCTKSGYRAGPGCETRTEWVPEGGLLAPVCAYHKLIHLDQAEKYRVNSGCYEPDKMQHKYWFVLSPVEEFFYKNIHPDYIPLPPFAPECDQKILEEGSLQLIYPRAFTEIYVPKTLDGSRGKTVFKAAHRNEEATIFWHIDQQYIGKTQHFHHLECAPGPGMHELVLMDEGGNTVRQKFEIVEKEE
jgi:penicillin-binding protein 1C